MLNPMRKKGATEPSPGDTDDVPPLPRDFGRSSIVREALRPIRCGPDAPQKFKNALARAKGKTSGMGVLQNRRAG